MAAFADLPDELRMLVARMLLRDDPLDVGRLVSSSQALRQMTIGDSVVVAELRAARTLATQQRLSELRVVAGLEGEGDMPVLQWLLPALDAPPELQWAPPEPTTRLSISSDQWRLADNKARGRAMARLLRVSGSLTGLYLGGNGLGAEGAKALAAGVAASSFVASLILNHNNVGCEGAKALAAGVAASGSMAILNLNSNNIGDEGAEALAAVVAASGSLAIINLGCNRIGDNGAKALATGVAASGSMVIL